MAEWTAPSRKPRAYTSVICRTEEGAEYHGLCWSPARGTFIEPITNLDAEPVIGVISGWRYPDPEPEAGPSP